MDKVFLKMSSMLQIMRALKSAQFIPFNNLPVKKDHSTYDKSKQSCLLFLSKNSNFPDENFTGYNRCLMY